MCIVQQYGYTSDGPLFKARNWKDSNLRWDLRPKQMMSAFRKGNRKNIDDWGLLQNLTLSLSGGGLMPRSKFIFDRLDLPEVRTIVSALLHIISTGSHAQDKKHSTEMSAL